MLVAMFVVAQGTSGSGHRSSTARQLPVEPWVFGVVAFCIIVALLALTFAFRSVGKRH